MKSEVFTQTPGERVASEASQVRGHFNGSRDSSQSCYTLPVRIPVRPVRELRRSQTEAEKVARYLLRDRHLGAKFRRQCRIDSWVIDFYCFEHRVAVELDGGVHSQPSQIRKDARKEDYLRTLGIRLLRIPNG